MRGSRVRRVLVGLAFAAAAIAAGSWGWTRLVEREANVDRRADAARMMNELMSGKYPVGGPFVLADADGRRVSLADFKGRLVLVYFGFTGCPDVCPTDLASIAQALRDLGPAADGIQPLFITLDPERDKPAVLREYAAAFHPRLVALTGSESEIRRVAADYKVFFEKVPLPGTSTYTIDHTAYTFLTNRDGRFVTLFPPGTPPERMAVMLREQLAAGQ